MKAGKIFNTGWRYKFPFLILAVIVAIGLSQPITEVAQTNVIPIDHADTAWILIASALVFLMTPGLGFFYGGMVRYKNLVSTLLQSFVALGIVSIMWVVVGFSIAFGDSVGGFFGNPATFFMFKNVGAAVNPDFAATIPFALFALFQLKFAIITPALITGGLAERVRFSSLILFIVLFSLIIYAPLAHWTWHPEGFLRQWGVLDFAGGTVVHISAGFAALAGAISLGRRYTPKTQPQPTNIPYILLGTGLLWFGWFGFNGGSALAANETAVMAFINTNIASATGMLTWLFLDSISSRKRSAVGACIGAVIGLVAITPAAGYVTVGQSLFFGFISVVVSYTAVKLKSKTNIDDTLDVFPCHGLGGIVGMILTGVFAKDVGLVYGETSTFIHHLLALGIVGAFTFFGSLFIYKITDLILPIRVSIRQEEEGLDLTQHGEEASDWRSRCDA